MTDMILTIFDWVPEMPRGYVRDLRVRGALEETVRSCCILASVGWRICGGGLTRGVKLFPSSGYMKLSSFNGTR